MFLRLRCVMAWACLLMLPANGLFLTGASAGTTGSISGTILDEAGTGVPGVTVTMTSNSQTAKATTDASGRFTLISLAPDTYTIGLAKEGYEVASFSGINIISDQTVTPQFSLHRALKTIGKVTATSNSTLVRPGTTTDVYSANAAITAAAAPLGGGGSLTSAYSAISAFPGAFVPPGQAGVNQSVYIRGGYYDQVGYEYDGVPVNRSFDNFPGHSASTFGQQELQIYTGGGGAGQSATGLSGFINQVVKTGTYPPSAGFSVSAGTPTFYHLFSGEISGSTSNHRFTYYGGFEGYNQDFRYFDNFNGAGQIDTFPFYGPSNKTTNLAFFPAVYPTCNADLSTPSLPSGVTAPYQDPGCFAATNPAYSSFSSVADRQGVANFHYLIPHSKDAGNDDIQFLYVNSAQFRQYYSGPNDAGPNIVAGAVGTTAWPDYLTYPSGTSFLAPASVMPVAYPFAGSPTNRCYNIGNVSFITTIPNSCPIDANGNETQPSMLPGNYRDGRWDTASIEKLQYQWNIGTSAYVRLFGYAFYSYTNRSGASRRGIGSGFGAANYGYLVDSHTRGTQLEFADQISDKHQLSGWINYVTANSNRVNNFDYLNTGGQQVSNLTNGTSCFASADGNLADGEAVTAGARAPCNDPITQGTFDSPTSGQSLNCAAGGSSPIPAAACTANASWLLTYNGNQGGLNQVRPQFAAIALADQWRPNSSLNVNLGFRVERDQYNLSNTNTAGKNFWFARAQQEYCYNPVTLAPVFVPQAPQLGNSPLPFVTFNCPVDSSSGSAVQTVHPDGLNGHLLLSNTYNPTIVQSYFLPRIGATYTVDPLSVLRFSAGRYAQQPQAYQVQYNSIEDNLANQLIGFLPFGFTTPRHDALPQYSNNYDFSFEHSFKGTDVSVKLTPYYRYATNQLYSATVYNQSPSFNSGTQTNTGIEFQLLKGNFAKNGLSGLFSYTWLNSKEKWENYQNTSVNPVDTFNTYVTQYNALTRTGGGAPCYLPFDSSSGTGGTPDPACASTSIRNPYYTSAAQPLFDRSGWYQTGLDVPYTSPNVFSLILNYRHGPFAITPALSLNQGTFYGSPADVTGIDPRNCAQNSATTGIATKDPLQADYTSCSYAATPTNSLYIPNPTTGRFDSFGQFQQPWQLNVGAQLSYDFNPKVKATFIVANLFNQCFGGSSTPWSSAYAPSATVCGYFANPFYVSNQYNGNSRNDVGANGFPLNKYFSQPFVPSYGDASAFNYPTPLNMYFTLQFKV